MKKQQKMPKSAKKQIFENPNRTLNALYPYFFFVRMFIFMGNKNWYQSFVALRAQKQLKSAIFGIFWDFWAQKTILRKRKVRNMCKYDVWALDEAFRGGLEQ